MQNSIRFCTNEYYKEKNNFYFDEQYESFVEKKYGVQDSVNKLHGTSTPMSEWGLFNLWNEIQGMD